MKAKVRSALGYLGALALIAVSTVVPSSVSAATSYDFSSSTAEASALGSSLVSAGFTITFTAIAAFAVLALALMGAGYAWRKFKSFSGVGRKI